MSWDLDNSRPIYLQIMERIQQDIVSGHYKAGDKLPSVRDLALEAAVNPNTMQKALAELERSGLVYSQRTSGRYISEDKKLLGKIRREMAEEHIHRFLEAMHQLGFTTDDVSAMVQDILKEEA
ncbi:MAG: GntR family transcriptional regulator [Hespellia sp.]|nr:GntR family transcriptional regulator [Hespellia sp.]